MARTDALDLLLLRLPEPASWDAIAKKLGLSRRALQNLRFGRVKRPHAKTIMALATLLKTTPEKVLAAIQAGRDGA